jgi:hypothetical protein
MDFNFEDEDLQKCQKVFNRINPEKCLFMNHYDLAKDTPIEDSALWKKFLMDKRVSEWLSQELQVYQDAQYRKLIRDTSNSKSYGAAQVLGAFNKTMENNNTKEGSVFVYMCVPLNDREKDAPNTTQLTENIFRKE